MRGMMEKVREREKYIIIKCACKCVAVNVSGADTGGGVL